MNINFDYNVIEDAVVIVRTENKILRNITLKKIFEINILRKTLLTKI